MLDGEIAGPAELTSSGLSRSANPGQSHRSYPPQARVSASYPPLGVEDMTPAAEGQQMPAEALTEADSLATPTFAPPLDLVRASGTRRQHPIVGCRSISLPPAPGRNDHSHRASGGDGRSQEPRPQRKGRPVRH